MRIPKTSEALEPYTNHGTDDSRYPHEKRCRQWIRARGTISPSGGHQAHLSAIAYMSDSFLIGTVARVHGVWTFKSQRGGRPTIDEETLRKMLHEDEEKVKRIPGMTDHVIKGLRAGKTLAEAEEDRPEIGMMVSLDHSIYFHRPRDFRADDWMFTEMESPWAGDGRGLAISKIWSKDGKLIATCVQEVSHLRVLPRVPALTFPGCCPLEAASREQAVDWRASALFEAPSKLSRGVGGRSERLSLFLSRCFDSPGALLRKDVEADGAWSYAMVPCLTLPSSEGFYYTDRLHFKLWTASLASTNTGGVISGMQDVQLRRLPRVARK